jgi:hypothetical protein
LLVLLLVVVAFVGFAILVMLDTMVKPILNSSRSCTMDDTFNGFGGSEVRRVGVY